LVDVIEQAGELVRSLGEIAALVKIEIRVEEKI
jgi:hypothetical protein